eukprot:5833863-Prymnesium_polylepis.3
MRISAGILLAALEARVQWRSADHLQNAISTPVTVWEAAVRKALLGLQSGLESRQRPSAGEFEPFGLIQFAAIASGAATVGPKGSTWRRP